MTVPGGETDPRWGPGISLRWEGDGTYVPVCVFCEYEGKPRWDHGAARGACLQHACSGGHRRARRLQQDGAAAR